VSVIGFNSESSQFIRVARVI